MKTKQYIQPATLFIALGAERLCQGLSGSIGNGIDANNADAPLRNFQGDKQGLKYLI